MRRWFLASVLAVLPLPALAQQPDAGSQTVLHLSQPAERRVARDLLHADLRAEARGTDPRSVEAAINRSMEKALAQAKDVKGIDVATGAYAVNRETPSGGTPDWAGSQSLFLSGTDSAALLALTATLQSDGLVMSNLEYEVSPSAVRGIESTLTSEALSALGQRATAIAQQLHVSVLGYRNLNVGNAQTAGGPMPRFAIATAAAMPAPVAAPGEATVRVAVSADVLLGTKKP
jgi:predicted secreted protein